MGSIHALHDGLDCGSFTIMANANPSNLASPNPNPNPSPNPNPNPNPKPGPNPNPNHNPNPNPNPDQANAKSERQPCNYFMGTSREAWDTNLRYHYLAAIHLQLQLQGSTENCIRTAENPQAARQFHPLTRHIFERPKATGGLGSARCRLKPKP